MWPAAILALVFGGPLGACLFVAAGITTAIKAWKVDAEAVKRGEMPPTARLIDKWLDSRKAKGKAPASAKVKPYGSWAYVKQRWQAMWEDLGEQHTETRQAYKAAKAKAKETGGPLPPKPTMKETLTGWKWSIPELTGPGGGPAPATASGSTASASPATARPVPSAPWATAPPCPACGAPAKCLEHLGDDPAQFWCDPCRLEFVPAAPAGRRPPATSPAPRAADPGRSAGAAAAGATATLTRPAPADPNRCPRCNGPVSPTLQRDLGMFCPSCDTRKIDQGRNATTGCESCHQSGYAIEATPATLLNKRRDTSVEFLHDLNQSTRCPSTERIQQEAAHRRAPIIPPPARPAPAVPPTPQSATTEGDPMTTTVQQSGEVTGIPSAVNFLEKMAAAHRQHADNEALVASLAGMKVGPGDLDLVRAAMTKSADAAELYTAAATELDRNNAGVRQGYGSAPDAADKHAQVAE